MLEEQRQLIRGLAAHDPIAAEEFVHVWRERILYWTSQHARPHRVEEYAQEVWAHLMAGNWMRLLQWRPLYDDSQWNEHSLASFLKAITVNKVRDLVDAEPPELPRGLDPNDIIDRTTPVGWNPKLEAERSRLFAAYQFCSEFFNANDHLALKLWFEGHDANHIAEQIETNTNNVYQRRSYLLRRLRDCLLERLPEYFRHV